jgi:hypothetical protein
VSSRSLSRDAAAAVLAAAMEQVNAQRKRHERIAAAPETVLVGAGAALDSLLLLNFLVAAEGELRERHGVEVSLVDLLTAPSDAPLRSLAALAEHLVAATAAA